MTTVDKDAADVGNQGWGPQHSRTGVWHDPGPSVARGLSMAGIDYLKAMIAGELPPPPIAELMQFALVEAEPGNVVFTCQPDGSVYNPNGGVHGGLVCTLLDSVAGQAVHSTLPAGKGYTSIEIKVDYLKAVRVETGPLTATGTVESTPDGGGGLGARPPPSDCNAWSAAPTADRPGADALRVQHILGHPDLLVAARAVRGP